MAFYINDLVTEGLTKSKALSLDLTSAATANTTTSLTISSTVQQVFTGSTTGQKVQLPDATTLSVGHVFIIWNQSSVDITIQDAGTTSQLVLGPSRQAIFTLLTNGTTAGSWTYAQTRKTILLTKSGAVSSGSFIGTPRKATVTFGTAFPTTSYSVVVTGSDARAFTVESKTTSGFTISANAVEALTGDVYWQCMEYGQSS
jgi:hypothetical protein